MSFTTDASLPGRLLAAHERDHQGASRATRGPLAQLVVTSPLRCETKWAVHRLEAPFSFGDSAWDD